MRNLKLTDITSSIGMPLKSGSLTHVQLAYKEALDAITKNNIGTSYDNTKGYVLYGCVNSGSGSNYVISAGAIFYDGEIYLVDATSFSTSGSDVPVCTITTTYYTGTNADQVTFTDSVGRNVHEIRKIVIASGASGSGTFNYANAIFFKKGWIKNASGFSVSVFLGSANVDSSKFHYLETIDTVTIYVEVILLATGSGSSATARVTLPSNLYGTTEITTMSYANIGGALSNGYIQKRTTNNLLEITGSGSYTNGQYLYLIGEITYPK